MRVCESLYVGGKECTKRTGEITKIDYVVKNNIINLILEEI